MDKPQAKKLLGLTRSESNQEITKVYHEKKSMVETKLSSAPTVSLKQKLEQMLKALKQAHELLMEPEDKINNLSPLSQTKMADLPGAGPTTGAEINIQPGATLAGRYQIKQQIGAGGMGVVFSAFDSNTQKEIALKILLPALLKNDRAKERFMDEARISQQLSHPNIVNVYDVQQDGDYYFLTMELLEGQDLRQLMENRNLAGQPFTVEDVQEIIAEVSKGLSNAHQHTVHRDIKPENIWLTEQGDYKIMDFGIARVQSTSQRTQTGAAMGTAYYMAPEQLKGQADIDGRADQYALSVLAYELLSGEVPAGMIEAIQTHRKDVPKGMANAIHKGLSPRPENRFETIAEFSHAIVSGKVKTSSGIPVKGLSVVVILIGLVFAIGTLVKNGSLDSIWEAIKPVDQELIAAQKAEAERVLVEKKADVAKIQGEIKNYQKRLDSGKQDLKFEVRDAERNKSANLKQLQHWQQLTDDYLFESSTLTDLEGELSKAESLLSANSFEAANTTMTTVRDGYINLWEQFSAAENLSENEQEAFKSKNKWQQRSRAYQLVIPADVGLAEQSEEEAKKNQLAGNFKTANKNWLSAINHWQEAYKSGDQKVNLIEQAKQAEKLRIAKIAKDKADKIEAERLNKIAAAAKLAADKLALKQELEKTLDAIDYIIDDNCVYKDLGNDGYCRLNISGTTIEYKSKGKEESQDRYSSSRYVTDTYKAALNLKNYFSVSSGSDGIGAFVRISSPRNIKKNGSRGKDKMYIHVRYSSTANDLVNKLNRVREILKKL